jgi:hypothetical protein
MSGLLDTLEGRRAQTSPRAMKDPRSREYAIQTLASLKRYLESKQIDEQRLREELTRIKDNRHWEVLGYKSLDEYLKAETGLTAAEILGRANKAKIKAACQVAREMGVVLSGDDLNEARASGGKDGGRGNTKPCDNSSKVSRPGNDQVHLARKILTTDPDTFSRLESGEFRSVRAAAKSIGIIKDKPTKAIPIETPEAAVQSLRKVFSDEAIVAALKAGQEAEPLPADDEDQSFARIVDRLSVSDRVGLMLYLMRDPDAIPDDTMNAPAMAREWFNALDHDEALSFMEWANNQFWQSKAA